MTTPRESCALVAFKKQGDSYQGSTPIGNLALFREDPAETMRFAADAYSMALREIVKWQADVELLRRTRTPLSARKAWELGDIMHKLNEVLAMYGCQLENMYEHLQCHAGLNRKWLSKYVTFRRYVDDQSGIPADLKWHSIEKVTKSAGQAIAAGLPVEA